MNKFLIITTFLFIYACGYQPINKTNDFKFAFKKIEIIGDKISEQNFSKNFLKYKKTSNADRFLNIKINSSLEKLITSKNKSGDATNYSIKIIADVKIIENNINILSKTYEEKTNYNNKTSKFELKQYENILIKDMIKEISFEIINDVSLIND